MFGLRSRLSFVIGGTHGTTGLREVDIYAAGRLLTCDDSSVYLPQFTGCLMRAVGMLLEDDIGERFRRPNPDLSAAENFRRLGVEGGDTYFRYRFMDWGPTTDNISACLFISDGIASIPFSFWRPAHHDPSELGQVFVAELPERELIRLLHQAASELLSLEK